MEVRMNGRSGSTKGNADGVQWGVLQGDPGGPTGNLLGLLSPPGLLDAPKPLTVCLSVSDK